MIDGLVRLVGSVLGGVLYALFGFPTLVLADAGSYLVSALGCYLIRYRAPRRRSGPVTLTGSSAELRAGLRHVWRQRFLRGLLFVTAMFYLANGALTALLVPFARIQLHADTGQYGFLLAALGVGYLFGAPLARLLIHRYSTRLAVLVSVPWLSSCFGLAFGMRDYSVTFTAFALAGAPAVVLIVAVQTAYQSHTPDRMLGRVASAFLTVEMTVSVLGASAASAVAETSGPTPVVVTSLALLGGLVLVLPRLLPSGPNHLAPGDAGPTGPADAATAGGAGRPGDTSTEPDHPPFLVHVPTAAVPTVAPASVGRPTRTGAGESDRTPRPGLAPAAWTALRPDAPRA
jgi:predicted MFS family arabinose efflux permease